MVEFNYFNALLPPNSAESQRPHSTTLTVMDNNTSAATARSVACCSLTRTTLSSTYHGKLKVSFVANTQAVEAMMRMSST